MRRTSPTMILLTIAGGFGVGWLVQLGLLAQGQPAFAPGPGLAAVLAAPAVLAVALAWPIRRGVRASVSVTIDPFYAVRVAGLAKACSAAGALFLGIALGLTLQLLLRPIIPGELVLHLLVCAAGAAILLVGGLIAEACCTLPPPGADAGAEGATPTGSTPTAAARDARRRQE